MKASSLSLAALLALATFNPASAGIAGGAFRAGFVRPAAPFVHFHGRPALAPFAQFRPFPLFPNRFERFERRRFFVRRDRFWGASGYAAAPYNYPTDNPPANYGNAAEFAAGYAPRHDDRDGGAAILLCADAGCFDERRPQDHYRRPASPVPSCDENADRDLRRDRSWPDLLRTGRVSVIRRSGPAPRRAIRCGAPWLRVDRPCAAARRFGNAIPSVSPGSQVLRTLVVPLCIVAPLANPVMNGIHRQRSALRWRGLKWRGFTKSARS